MPDNSTILLFADIADSVGLYEAVGDATAKNIVVELQRRLNHVVSAHGGVVHEITGDEIMCRFNNAEQAVKCAASIHQCTTDYANQNAPPSQSSLQMRVGIHSGPAILDKDRLFGDTVNTAARIMSIAQAGQTITTASILELLPDDMKEIAREFDRTKLKGKSDPVVVYDIPWQLQDLTQIKEVSVESATMSLQLNYRGHSLLITTEDCPVWLGRAINNWVVVNSDPVSRRHVAIEYTRNRFLLSDKSTNGTHVYPDNSEDIYLRREQMPLWGEGQLSLGAPRDEAPDHLIEYQTIRASI